MLDTASSALEVGSHSLKRKSIEIGSLFARMHSTLRLIYCIVHLCITLNLVINSLDCVLTCINVGMNVDSYAKVFQRGTQLQTLPAYMRSSTRGTAQKTDGFSSPMSSTNNLTSCTRKLELNKLMSPTRRRNISRHSPHAKIQLRPH